MRIARKRCPEKRFTRLYVVPDGGLILFGGLWFFCGFRCAPLAKSRMEGECIVAGSFRARVFLGGWGMWPLVGGWEVLFCVGPSVFFGFRILFNQSADELTTSILFHCVQQIEYVEFTYWSKIENLGDVSHRTTKNWVELFIFQQDKKNRRDFN